MERATSMLHPTKEVRRQAFKKTPSRCFVEALDSINNSDQPHSKPRKHRSLPYSHRHADDGSQSSSACASLLQKIMISQFLTEGEQLSHDTERSDGQTEVPPLEDASPIDVMRMMFHSKRPSRDRSKKVMPSDSNSPRPRTQVIRLPWIDHRGVDGEYSGEVNALIQPHGFGTLRLVDGTMVSGHWGNGTALEKTSYSCSGGHNSRISSTSYSTTSMSSGGHDWRISLAKTKPVHDPSSRLSGSDPIENDNNPHDTDKFNRADRSLNRRTSSLSYVLSHPKYSSYELGDSPKSPSHMIVASSVEKAIHSVESLKLHDFAFVLRSNGEWCFSIVAQKVLSCHQGHDDKNTPEKEEPSILFVINTEGCTKRVRRKHWGIMVRLLNPDA